MPKAQDRLQPPAPGLSPAEDPIWDRALDWLLLTRAAPRDATLQAQLEAWLAEAEAHRLAYRRAQQVWDVTGMIPRSPVAAEVPHRARSRWRSAPRLVAFAALAACLLLVALPYLRLSIQADYRTGTGELREIALADGTKVTLDSESAIALGGSLEGGSGDRQVTLLAGRAFFEVAHDGDRQFAATAGELVVKVHGTSFDLRLSDAAATVALQRGSVSASGAAAEPGVRLAPGAKLAPGDRATLDRRRGALVLDRVAPEKIATWRSGRLTVEGATIAEMVEELNRYHHGLILLQDSALAARRVTGVFDLRDPQAALRALLQPFGGRILTLTPYLLIVEST